MLCENLLKSRSEILLVLPGGNEAYLEDWNLVLRGIYLTLLRYQVIYNNSLGIVKRKFRAALDNMHIKK